MGKRKNIVEVFQLVKDRPVLGIFGDGFFLLRLLNKLIAHIFVVCQLKEVE